MVHHLRFISFAVGLLLSLAALGDSLALAKGGMVTLEQNDGALKSGQGLRDKTKMVDATGNVWLAGRRMGMEKVKEDKGPVKKGKAKNSLNNSSGSSITKDSSSTKLQSDSLTSLNMKTTEGNDLEPVNLSNSPQSTSQALEASSTPASLGSSKVSGPSPGQFQTDETQRLLAATAEIFKMLKKDYHQNAHRRPPINNDLPLGSINVKP